MALIRHPSICASWLRRICHAVKAGLRGSNTNALLVASSAAARRWPSSLGTTPAQQESRITLEFTGTPRSGYHQLIRFNTIW
jgi:hypothetical protein